MKQLTKACTYKTIATLFILSFFQVMAWAQDSASSVTTQTTSTTTQEHTWYTQPWAWVVGGAVLLLLLVALLRNNSSGTSGTGTTDKVTYTKTTETDTNV